MTETHESELAAGVAWEDLEVVLAALRHRSLNRSARALRIGQSTASRRLQRLEERLGARIFDRTPEGLLPTDFASQLEPLARLIEGHMGDIDRLARGRELEPRGRFPRFRNRFGPSGPPSSSRDPSPRQAQNRRRR